MDEKTKKLAVLYLKIIKVLCRKPIKEDMIGYGQGQVRIITYLADHPEGVLSGELSSEISVGTGRIGNVLKELEKKGLVTREDDSSDRRKTIVKITPLGVKIAEEKKNEFISFNEKVINAIGYDEFYHFLQTLQKIITIE